VRRIVIRLFAVHDGGRSFEPQQEAIRVSAEVRPEELSKPEPNYKKTFKIALLLGSLFILLALGYTLNQTHRTSRNQKVVNEFLAWTNQFAKDNPSVVLEGYTAMSKDFGAAFHYEGNYKTPTDRTIAIDFRHRERLFNRSGRLIFTAGGRSITWPVEDIERGRKVDLEAEFPEAFR
jgi:hypothetical protein